MIRCIAAIDRRRGVAKHGYMPWFIPEDSEFFTDQTKSDGGNLLTGATTFRLAYQGKPLEGRRNYLLTHDTTPIEDTILVHDLDKLLADFSGDEVMWISGGAVVFEQILAKGKADELYLTHIDADFGCDQFFPEYEKDFVLTHKTKEREQNGFRFYYATYTRK